MRMTGLLLSALIVTASCAQAQSGGDLNSRLEQLAERGNGEAQYHLGMIYWTGEGVAKDAGKAIAYFEQAAASGDPLGAYKMGCLYDGQDKVFDRDAARALKFKLVAAEAGYALAQQDVAALYAEQKNFGTALQWLERAAKQGTAGALMSYASIHNGAPGIAPDPAITAAYFQLFLDRGEATDEQRSWLKSFEAKLTQAQRDKARRLVDAYRPAPTPLTLKALSGVEAAQALVDEK